ncbi:putative type VI secretion system effector [Franconibacter daqui]
MTKDRKFSGEFIEFDEIRRKKSHCETIIEVNNKWVIEHPDECDPLKLERENEQASAEITRLEAILATEPPPPELPPRKPLFKVSGVLEEFSAQKVIGYFTDREYDPEGFAKQEASEQVGSLLLAVTGNAAGSAVTGQSKIRIKDACNFVRGKINGVPFSGWLGKTHVRSGDYVEMAVMGRGDHYVVYAIALPEFRTITMTPKCACGREGDIYFETRRSVPVMAGIYIVLLLVLKLFGLDWSVILFCFAIMAAMLLIASIYAVISIRKKPNPKTLLAESIFTALNFTEPRRVDLRKITKEQAKKMSPVTDREMPSSRSAWMDFFYYY